MSDLNILISSTGLSCGVVGASPIRFTICMPDDTLPKIVCLPSSQGQGARLGKVSRLTRGECIRYEKL